MDAFNLAIKQLEKNGMRARNISTCKTIDMAIELLKMFDLRQRNKKVTQIRLAKKSCSGEKSVLYL